VWSKEESKVPEIYNAFLWVADPQHRTGEHIEKRSTVRIRFE
jgi:hypothetical protein